MISALCSVAVATLTQRMINDGLIAGNLDVIVNTGTWLKKLTRVPTWFRRLPDVYVPSFHLNYFRIREEDGKVALDYGAIDKEVRSGLTLLQRLMILGRSREGEADIPQTTLLEPPAQTQNGR